MATHVMVDLETWGNGNNALPVSIGAVKFDATTILDRFHVGIDPVSAQKFKLDIDAETMLWWLDPERADARKQWLQLEKVDLPTALEGFRLWLENVPGDEVPLPDDRVPHKFGEPLQLWGNGATFDNIIMRSAYSAIGEDTPWRFWMDRCYRTMKNMCPEIKLQRIGTHHNALDDAESQAVHLQQICAQLGVVL